LHYRFGEFTLDPQAAELRRNGEATPLPPLPARALALLLERAGSLVTRDELRQHLWPDRFVEFEQSLHSCIRKIRRQLRDDVESPKYIETLQGRGYRFIAPVERVDSTLTSSSALASPPTERHRTSVGGRYFAGLVVVAALALVALPFADRSGPTTPERVKVAVIPFEAEGADTLLDYVSAALTDELTTRLASLGPDQLAVIARTSAARVAGDGLRIDEAGATLGVDFLVMGRVKRSAQQDSFRVTAELVRVSDQTDVWVESHQVARRDWLEVERLLARRVAQSLLPHLSTVWPRPTRILPEQVDLDYRKAQYFLEQAPDGPSKSVPLLREVLRQAPSHVPAMTALAVAYSRIGQTEAARRAAFDVLAIDSGNATAHHVLGSIAFLFDWDPEAADAHHRAALRAAPYHSRINHSYAALLASRGQMPAALHHLERALEVDPVSPSVNADLGFLFMRAGQYDRAAEQCSLTLELVPGNVHAQDCLIHANVRLGRPKLALGHASRLMRALGAPAFVADSIVSASPRDGLDRYFRWRATTLSTVDARVTNFERALVLADAGQDGSALAALEEAMRQREPGMLFLEGEERFARLSHKARFRALLARPLPS
jgi:DNA-binding winged helix-turn-helix (wHTH) protein/TolB-like protein/Tfp pilus assembly protein PilF